LRGPQIKDQFQPVLQIKFRSHNRQRKTELGAWAR
jgi:hypothetical protein